MVLCKLIVYYFAGLEYLFSINSLNRKKNLNFSTIYFLFILEFYTPLLDLNNSIAELKLRKVKLAKLRDTPKSSLETFLLCDSIYK